MLQAATANITSTSGNIELRVKGTNKFIDCGFAKIKTSGNIEAGNIEFGSTMKAGYGVNTVMFSPENNSTKTLKMSNDTIGPNCFFNIDMANKGQVRGLIEPTAANMAATKAYVDAKFRQLYQALNLPIPADLMEKK